MDLECVFIENLRVLKVKVKKGLEVNHIFRNNTVLTGVKREKMDKNTEIREGIG